MATRVRQHVERPNEGRRYETIVVKPLTPVIGAEIEGVDLSTELSPAQLAEVKQAFLDHCVIVFRDQHLSREDHKRFGRHFGRLHVHPYHVKAEEAGKQLGRDLGPDPEILIVKADANSKYVAGEEWHTDVSCDAEPPMGSMLYITQTPEIGCGGDTCFLSTYEAYETLSPKMKAFLDGLDAMHDGAKPYVGGYGIAAPPSGWPRTLHPVVPRHPDTGRKLLFVNRGFTSHVEGLNRDESAALLEMLWRHIESNPIYQCRIRWQPNTLVFWDNRCTQHHSVWDYFPHSRYGERVSIIGTPPSR